MTNREAKTEKIIRRLADIRWKELRRVHNREFMGSGPGVEWDRYKNSEFYREDCEEIMLLRHYLGLPMES